jgi:hypothetical protein
MIQSEPVRGNQCESDADAYRMACDRAKVFGHDEAHTLLSEILDQEKAANSKLTNLAVDGVNSAMSKKAPRKVRSSPARPSAA